MKVTEREDCRACKGKLESVWFVGDQYLISYGGKSKDKAPLHLTKCASCHLLQLKHTVDPDTMFREYFYRSGTSQTMREHLKGIVEEIQKRIKLEEDDAVIDIGCNDGTLLSFYPRGIDKFGYDPSKTIPTVTIPEPWGIIRDYFSAMGTPAPRERVKVITAIAMFYDLDDPNRFLRDIKQVLAPDGLFVIQMNYLPTMLANNIIDNVSHEHLCYYSLGTLNKLLDKNGFDVVDVSFHDINGGVFRVFAKHQKFPKYGSGMSASVVEAFYRERVNLSTMKPYEDFRTRLEEIRYKIYTWASLQVAMEHKTIYAYGLGTRGNSLLQFIGLDHKLIKFGVERDASKVGTVTAGTKIPIISEEQMRQNQPDYLLLLPYWFKAEVIEREKSFLVNGGKWIIPLPTPYLLGAEKL